MLFIASILQKCHHNNIKINTLGNSNFILPQSVIITFLQSKKNRKKNYSVSHLLWKLQMELLNLATTKKLFIWNDEIII